MLEGTVEVGEGWEGRLEAVGSYGRLVGVMDGR